MSEHRRSRVGLILPVLAFAQFISAMDYNIVYVALPEIGRALRFSPHTLQWVVSAYAVAFGGLLLLGGRAADRLGRRRMFVIALAVYGTASLGGGLAPTPGLLVAARAPHRRLDGRRVHPPRRGRGPHPAQPHRKASPNGGLNLLIAD